MIIIPLLKLVKMSSVASLDLQHVQLIHCKAQKQFREFYGVLNIVLKLCLSLHSSNQSNSFSSMTMLNERKMID